MKKTIYLILGLIAVLALAGCARVEKEAPQEEFYEKIPVVDAYYNGEKIWFIHTDVTDAQLAETLTKMVGYRTIYAPKNAEAVDASKLAKFYVFTNGIDHAGEKPWGGGPFGFQIDIFDSIPGDEGYTALKAPYLVTWGENARPRILKSVAVLQKAEAAGELTIEEAGVVVNTPVVRWPGGRAALE